MLRSTGFYLAVAFGLLLAVASFNLTSVRPTSAPPTAFSADRAMADVSAIAQAAHPTGSRENTRVRDRLVHRLTELGFAVEIYRAPSLTPPSWKVGEIGGAYPETLVAVRPGQDRALPPLAIMSHYDSVTNSPGAADDAAGVAASLETARAIAAAGPVARDLVLIVTDGEEPGLFGARAFFAGHPLAKRLGVVLNLETRGSSGPTLMFETSPESGALVRRFAAAAPHPSSNSLLAWVYSQMPNDTDFTLAREAGVAGMNFGFIGRPFDYHSATATPANLDRRSLQDMGDQVLATATSLLSAAPLPARAPSLVYSDLFGLMLVAYPAWVGWLVLLAAVGLFGLALRRLGPVRPSPLEILRGAGGFLLAATFSILALHALGRLMPPPDNPYQNRIVAEFGLYLAAMGLLAIAFIRGVITNLTRGEGRWRAAIVAVAIGLVCCLVGGIDLVGVGLAVVVAVLAVLLLGRSLAPTALWSGVIAIGIVLAVALQLLAPALAFLIAWPVLIGAGLAAATRVGVETRFAPTLLVVVVGGAVYGWLARLGALAFDGLGISMPEVLAAFLVLPMFVVAPLAARAADSRFARPAAVGAIAVALLLAGFVALHDTASQRYPTPSHILHVSDLAHGRTFLASGLAEPDTWTRGVLGPGAKPEPIPALLVRRALIVKTAAITPTVAPVVTSGREGERATLTITAAGARELRLSLKGAPLDHLTIAGVPAELKPGRDGWAVLRWHNPREGVTLAFDAKPGARLDWRLASLTDGWPAASSLPARPPSIMPAQNSDSSVTLAEGKVAW